MDRSIVRVERIGRAGPEDAPRRCPPPGRPSTVPRRPLLPHLPPFGSAAAHRERRLPTHQRRLDGGRTAFHGHFLRRLRPRGTPSCSTALPHDGSAGRDAAFLDYTQFPRVTLDGRARRRAPLAVHHLPLEAPGDRARGSRRRGPERAGGCLLRTDGALGVVAARLDEPRRHHRRHRRGVLARGLDRLRRRGPEHLRADPAAGEHLHERPRQRRRDVDHGRRTGLLLLQRDLRPPHRQRRPRDGWRARFSLLHGAQQHRFAGDRRHGFDLRHERRRDPDGPRPARRFDLRSAARGTSLSAAVSSASVDPSAASTGPARSSKPTRGRCPDHARRHPPGNGHGPRLPGETRHFQACTATSPEAARPPTSRSRPASPSSSARGRNARRTVDGLVRP